MIVIFCKFLAILDNRWFEEVEKGVSSDRFGSTMIVNFADELYFSSQFCEVLTFFPVYTTAFSGDNLGTFICKSPSRISTLPVRVIHSQHLVSEERIFFEVEL